MCLGLASWFSECVNNLVYCCVTCFLTIPCCSSHLSSDAIETMPNRTFQPCSLPWPEQCTLSHHTQGTQEGKGRGAGAGGGDSEDMQVCTSWSMRHEIAYCQCTGPVNSEQWKQQLG